MVSCPSVTLARSDLALRSLLLQLYEDIWRNSMDLRISRVKGGINRVAVVTKRRLVIRNGWSRCHDVLATPLLVPLLHIFMDGNFCDYRINHKNNES